MLNRHCVFSWPMLGVLLAVFALQACGRSESRPAQIKTASIGSLSAAAQESVKVQGEVKRGASGGTGANRGTRAVSVSLVLAEKRDVPVQIHIQGVVAALASVDVRAQESSRIQKIHFTEGSFVKAGQLLFSLDGRTNDANLAKARAQMRKNAASLADAKRQFERAQQLRKQNFISQAAVDTALAQVQGLEATLSADQAVVDAAQVAVSNTRVLAPIGGRTGAIGVSLGSAVLADRTPLVTVTQLNPIAVGFTVPQRYLPEVLQAIQGRGAVVTVRLNEASPPLQGRLQFVDNAVDMVTGTVQAKAIFDNQSNLLWPGASVQVDLVVRTLKDSIVIPTAAIIQGQREAKVFVVEAGLARAQVVTVILTQDNESVVTGFEAGTQVVLDGKQNLKPGVRVLVGGKPSTNGVSTQSDAQPSMQSLTKEAAKTSGQK